MDHLFHRKLIRNYKTTLIDHTKYSLRLIDRCTEEGILTTSSADEIIMEQDPYTKLNLFYKSVNLMDNNGFNKLVQIMNEINTKQSSDLLDILTGKKILGVGTSFNTTGVSAPLNLVNPAVWFEVPSKNESFKGRTNELDSLHKLIMRNSGSKTQVVVQSQLTSIVGLGGIGKTSMAIQYAWDNVNIFDGNVIWINGESIKSMKVSFSDLAIKIGEEVEIKNDYKKSITKIYEYFSTSKCLFIFDNVDEYFGVMEDFLPTSTPNAITPFILITTRKRKLINRAVLLELNVLKPIGAHEFIQTELGIQPNENIELVQKLATKLQYFPLALKQAVAYIRMNLQERAKIFGNSEDPILIYLNKFEKKTIELLKFEHYNKETPDIYKKTVATTWLVTMDHILHEEEGGLIAGEILNLMAYFNPHAMKKTTFNNKYTKEDAENAILILRNYSMIDVTITESKIEIHSLVQTVVRENNKSEQNNTLAILIKYIDNFQQLCSDNISFNEIGHSKINSLTEEMENIVIAKKN